MDRLLSLDGQTLIGLAVGIVFAVEVLLVIAGNKRNRIDL